MTGTGVVILQFSFTMRKEPCLSYSSSIVSTNITKGIRSRLQYRFFVPEDGVGLVPRRRCLRTLAYYAFPRWYEFGEQQWNDILTGENQSTQRKTCLDATLSTTNPTCIDPGANLGLRGQTPATNGLSHGTAKYNTDRGIRKQGEGTLVIQHNDQINRHAATKKWS
jgi:hypothetical protein